MAVAAGARLRAHQSDVKVVNNTQIHTHTHTHTYHTHFSESWSSSLDAWTIKSESYSSMYQATLQLCVPQTINATMLLDWQLLCN